MTKICKKNKLIKVKEKKSLEDKKKSKIINMLSKIKNADEQIIYEEGDEYIDPDFLLKSNSSIEEEFDQMMKKEKPKKKKK